MFPTTDRSATIIDCLCNAARASGVKLFTGRGVSAIERHDGAFRLTTSDGEQLECGRLLLATGGTRTPALGKLVESLGHSLEPPVPSLFTFHVEDAWVRELAGVSVPHYWLGMVMVIIFSVQLNWLPAVGAGPGGSGAWGWDWEHMKYLILPAITTSVIPMGIVTRTVRALTGDILSQDFVEALRAKGLHERGVFLHVIKNAAPTALAVMGLQLGYMLGGSILIETVFAWPGTGFLMNDAIFRRDIPVLQGVILVLAMFFVGLNLIVDVVQTLIDPRIRRGASA
jgi:hypothetical protein